MTSVTDFSKAQGLPSLGFLSRHRKLLIVIALLCFSRALFPADINWMNDEPNLIRDAIRCNDSHTFAIRGMMGTFQRYTNGPLPVWLYQGVLLFTHDLRVLVIIRGILTAATIATGLLLLAGALDLWAPFAAVVLCSPWLWLYTRGLWDSTFNIPLATLTFGLYAHFARTKSPILLHAVVLLLFLAPFIHPMAVPFCAGMGAALLLFDWRSLLRHRYTLLCIPLLVAAIMSRFLWDYFHGHGMSYWRIHLAAALRIFPGAPYVSALGLYETFNPQWTWGQSARLGQLLDAFIALSAIACVFAILGLLTSIQRLANRYRDPRDRVAAACLLVILAQAAMFTLTDTGQFAYYFNSTWIVYAYFAWLGVTLIVCRNWGKFLITAHALGLLCTLIFIIIRVHLTAGTRDPAYGTTLDEQMRIVRELREYPSSTPLKRLPLQTWEYPQGLDVLFELTPSSPSRNAQSLDLRYATPNSWDAHLTIVPH